MTQLLQRWYTAGGSAAALLSEAVKSLTPGSECETDGAFLHRVELILLTTRSRGDLVMVCAWLSRLGATFILDAYNGDTLAATSGLEEIQEDLKRELESHLESANQKRE